tara:strand:- start:518 stop:712 length:195 start_codon:yes stop_codon:yes gene_type:complete
MTKMDKSKIDNIELDGINHRDAPKYVDAFIYSADYDGKKMTEAELDALNDDADYVHEQVIKQLN